MKQTLTPLLATFLLAVVATAASMPFWRRLCQRLGWIDEPGQRKIHDAPLALSGGLALLTGLIVSMAFWWMLAAAGGIARFPQELSAAFHRSPAHFTAIAAGLLAMTGLGWVDDRLELRPGTKFLGQLFVAVGAALGGVRCGIFDEQPALQLAVTVLWILTVTNAFNFIDNMNGLCAGLCIVAAIPVAILALRGGGLLPGILAAATAGAALGFLPFNYPAASAFLGDSGSHLIGFTLAVIVLEPGLWQTTHAPPASVLGPALLLAVPLLDLCWVVGWRTWRRKPFHVGDNNHLSHQLVRLGLSRKTAVAVLWSLAMVGSGLAIALW